MSVFKKYFITYFCALFAPLLVISFLFINYMGSYLKDGMVKNTRYMLSQVQHIIDMQLIGVNNISFQISGDHQLTPYLIKKNLYYGKYAQEALRSYKSTSSFVDEIFLYIRGDQYIYSTSSSYSISKFMDTRFSYEQWSNSDFIDTINHVQTPLVRPAENVDIIGRLNEKAVPRKIVSLIVPMPIYEPSPYGTLIFHIREEQFTKLISNIMTDYDGNTMIVDHEGNIITALKYKAYMNSGKFKALLANRGKQSGSTGITLDGEKYMVTSIFSDRTNWSYWTLVPASAVSDVVNQTKLAVTLVLFVVLLLSGLVIYYITFLHYKPIKQLQELFRGRGGEDSPHRNELDKIRSGIHHMLEINHNLSVHKQGSQAAVRDYLLSRLLKGQVYDLSENGRALEEAGLSFSNPYFVVAVMLLHDRDRLEANDRPQFDLAAIERNVPDGMQGFAKEYVETNSVVLLLTVRDKNRIWLTETLEEYNQRLRQYHNAHITMGVGRVYEEANLIGKSYLEAITALNYRLILGNDRLISIDELSESSEAKNSYPRKEIEALAVAIRREDKSLIDAAARSLVEFVKEGRISLFIARCICYDVINTIIKVLDEVQRSGASPAEYYPDVTRIMEFGTIEELVDVVKAVCFDLCDKINEGKTENSLVVKMRRYIEDNYSDPNCSINYLADAHELSESYLSRYFKSETGQTFTDYVVQLRIEKAKLMLVTTDVALKEIIQQVGYYDVSSFIRLFKKMTGVTPGAYRSRNS
ncbi:helix-turn-helix domain-containing protein [Cohnella soli]|uniref:Helix-turn-helix domain-containing protein n=1 Tax=Cohnella soli TaxID=425005 RepID=A0ABW0HS36_9BACL